MARFENLKKYNKVAILGIKGVAMSNIAIMLKSLGIEVYGYDTSDSQITDDALYTSGVEVLQIENALLPQTDLLLYSAAHGGQNSSQANEARSLGLQIMHQATIIQQIAQNFDISVAVCGCHGKTGTTSRLAAVYEYLQIPVSYCIGAPIFSIETHEKTSKTFFGGKIDVSSNVFIYEADEYAVSPPLDKTPKLEFYYPTHIINTNIDFDHPDVYRDLEHTRSVFEAFFERAKWVYRCESSTIEGNNIGIYEYLKTQGIDELSAASGLHSFTGVSRRLQNLGEREGVLFFDDYGHHPAEIKATVGYLKSKYPTRRLVVAFQSHTHSRTSELKDQFVSELAKAHVVVIDEVFASARESESQTGRVRAQDLVDMAQGLGHRHFHSYGSRDELVSAIAGMLKSNDICLTLGAGDIYKVMPKLQELYVLATKSLIKCDYTSHDITTWRTTVIMKYFARVSTDKDLYAIVSSPEFQKTQNRYILGEGSNTLFATKNYNGFVMQIATKGVSIVHEDQESMTFKLASGENWHENIRKFVYDYGLGGMENLALIPGTFGASAIQNVAAYGQALEDVFVSLTALDLRTMQSHIIDKTQAKFAYRTSFFKSDEFKANHIILDVTVRLIKEHFHTLNTSYHSNNESLTQVHGASSPTIRTVFDAICKIRQQKLPDPKLVGTNGSLFVNPIITGHELKELLKKFPKLQYYPSAHMQYSKIDKIIDTLSYKIAAGHIFEELGWKRRRLNNVGVWAKSALVLCNYGTDDTRDITAFIKLMQEDFKLHTGITIIPEINIVK